MLTVQSVLRESKLSTQKLWHSFVNIDGIKMNDGAIDQNKKTSECKAVLLFFKELMPLGNTYLDTVAFMSKHKKPLQEIEATKS